MAIGHRDTLGHSSSPATPCVPSKVLSNAFKTSVTIGTWYLLWLWGSRRICRRTFGSRVLRLVKCTETRSLSLSYTHTNTRTHIHTYARALTLTHTHTHTHAYAHTLSLPVSLSLCVSMQQPGRSSVTENVKPRGRRICVIIIIIVVVVVVDRGSRGQSFTPGGRRRRQSSRWWGRVTFRPGRRLSLEVMLKSVARPRGHVRAVLIAATVGTRRAWRVRGRRRLEQHGPGRDGGLPVEQRPVAARCHRLLVQGEPGPSGVHRAKQPGVLAGGHRVAR